MDMEFHYYITYFIALRAGFAPGDAYVIAYASQYTDDNTTVYRINKGGPGEYSNYISQTSNILKPQKELMTVYPAFHFMPGTVGEISGDCARRRDGKLHLMNTIPDSINSRQLLQAALDSHDPYRIGIATHMYADTFAHQNFVGFEESFNGMKGLFEGIVPDIGHADAGHQPDKMSLSWEDRRLVQSHSKIDNRERFLEAARCIYQGYADYLHVLPDSGKLTAQIAKATGKREDGKKARIDRYKKLIVAVLFNTIKRPGSKRRSIVSAWRSLTPAERIPCPGARRNMYGKGATKRAAGTGSRRP
ncbi:MAG TPA: hypothetical protein PLX02_03430 [Syntrophorhabdaceae bacterium]|nr:hypothetical protein [Syntrophorhabdaceae bacterium]HQM80651.1 hypothetical protein [Syntrophorhabdaceae bacterium]